MGGWLARYFEARGHGVRILDHRRGAAGRPRIPSIEVAAREADAIVFATPIDETAPVLARLLATGTDALIFDVLSLKSPILPLVHRAAGDGAKIASVHPMFGPSARQLSGRNLLLLSCGNRTADAAVGRLFAGSGLRVSRLPIDQHDRLIADALGLPQALDLLLLLALGTGRTSRRDLARAAGTSLRRHRAAAANLKRQSLALTVALQARNPYGRATLRRIRASVDRLERLLRDGDLGAIQVAIDRGLDRLGAVRAES